MFSELGAPRDLWGTLIELHRVGDDPALDPIDVSQRQKDPVRLELFVDHDFPTVLGRGPGTLEGLQPLHPLGVGELGEALRARWVPTSAALDMRPSAVWKRSSPSRCSRSRCRHKSAKYRPG